MRKTNDARNTNCVRHQVTLLKPQFKPQLATSQPGRKKVQLPHLRGSQGGVLAVRGRRQLPSSRGQKGAPEAGRGRLNYLLTSSKGTL